MASLSLVQLRGTANERLVTTIYCLLVVLIFSSLRGVLGNDHYSYYYAFIYQLDLFEFGYNYLNELSFFIFGQHFNGLLFVVAGISLFFYFFSAYKFTIYPIIAFIIIFCDLYQYFNHSGLRQGIALSVVLLAFYTATKGKYLAFLSLVFVAASFHKVALCVIPAYFILSPSFTRRAIPYLGLVILLAIFHLFSHIFVNYLSESNIRGGNLYFSEHYNVSNIQNYIIGTIKRLIPIMIIMWFIKVRHASAAFISIFDIYMIGFILYLGLYYFYPDIGVRLSSYYFIIEGVLMARLIEEIHNERQKIYGSLIILAWAIIRLLTYTNNPLYNYSLSTDLF